MLMDLLIIGLRTLLAIAIMFTLTKLLGKRQLSEMSLFGYISGISIGNIAAYIALEDTSLWGLAILSIVIWVAVTIVLENTTLKSKFMRNIIDSDRRLLIKDGVVNKEALKKERMTVNELLEQLRDNDVFRLADVESASIEANGDLSVFLKPEYQPLTASTLGIKLPREKEPITVIMDGSAELTTLQSNGLDQNWLDRQLQKVKLSVNDVFIAQYDNNTKLSIHTLDKKFIELDCNDGQCEPSNESDSKQLQQIKQSLLQAIAIIEQYDKQRSTQLQESNFGADHKKD